MVLVFSGRAIPRSCRPSQQLAEVIGPACESGLACLSGRTPPLSVICRNSVRAQFLARFIRTDWKSGSGSDVGYDGTNGVVPDNEEPVS